MQNIGPCQAFHLIQTRKPMYRPFLLAALLAAPAVHADSLSQADREALIEKLDSLKESAKEKATGRMDSASSAFRTGMASDSAAIELYLKCVEKVEFADQKKSAQDFREWKRHRSEQLDADGLGRCLRHQLRWLVLTMEAAEAKDPSTLAPKALEALDSIFANPQQFEGNVQPLRDPVTNTVFARAYSLGGMKVEKWPLSPLEIGQIFNQVVFPPLRAKENTDGLREQWVKRIKYEGVIHQYWSGGGQGGGRGGRGEKPKPQDGPSPEYEKFMTETQPDLMWQMEEDIYKSGDQKGAAVAMLQHLEKNITHPKAREWADRFRALVDPPKEGGAETAGKEN